MPTLTNAFQPISVGRMRPSKQQHTSSRHSSTQRRHSQAMLGNAHSPKSGVREIPSGSFTTCLGMTFGESDSEWRWWAFLRQIRRSSMGCLKVCSFSSGASSHAFVRKSLTCHPLEYDWSTLLSDRPVVDVGGGIGTVSMALSMMQPQLKIVVQDRQQVVTDGPKVCFPSPQM